ncbi:MAG: ATP-dependent acyl-CoA ligase [Deltaproteobacteria bacterium]|nr:MAG: ATP-dependent acyl-CoA ligase [Deltaproteobacteria bacterium]
MAARAHGQPDRRVQHREGGAGPSARPSGRRRGERRLERRDARPGVRGALRRLQGRPRQLHALDRARVREPRAPHQLPRPRRHPLAAHPALHAARGLREVAGRLLLAARAAPARRPRGHGEGDRLPRLRRREDGHRRRAGRRLGHARVVPETILDVLARDVATRGGHPFIVHEDRRLTYAELDRLASGAAQTLAALGVARGERVTLALGNSVEYLVTAFGILKAGAVLNPLNPALGAAELDYIVDHAEPRVVVTDAAHVAAFRRHACAVVTPEALSAAGEGAPEVTVGPDDPALLLYTSGTTGNPKGVLFTHGSSGQGGRHFLRTLDIAADDTILAVTPLFHGNAWGAVQTALHAGGTVAFPAAFHASEFWPLVHATGATVLYTLGTILAMLLARPPSEAERTSPLRVVLGLGSAPIRERVIERFGVAHVAECYGSTDAGVVTITPVGVPPRAGSCGPPVPGVEIRILDDGGHDLPPRAAGEIAVRSPSRMTAYFRDPGETALALREGWFLTGDLGWLDEDGWLYFVDRKKDVIRRGGENVSSVLVEKVLREHPRVAEVAVVGVPDPVLGQEIKAFVVASGPVGEDELREFAAARLARFQVPRLWEFRASLPKTATQRVEKYKLRRATGPPLG